MKKATKRALLLISITGAFLTTVGFLRGISGSPVITIINSTEEVVSDVVLRGTGFSKELGQLRPGEKQQVLVKVIGESGLKIFYSISGQTKFQDDLAYLEGEGGYCVTLSVTEGKVVVSNSDIFCFSLKRLFY